jgi:hypothetical protein
MEREKLIDKISKLFALGDNNPSEEEAKSAISRARKLMAEHDLTEQEIRGGKKSDVIKSSLHVSSASWVGMVSQEIANNFRCKTYFILNRSHMAFLGKKDDVEVVIRTFNYVYTFIVAEGKRIRRIYRAKGLSTEGVFKSYIRGFIVGLREMFEEQNRSESKEWALVMKTPVEVIEEFNKLNLETSRSKSISVTDYEAYKHGVSQGREVEVRKALC